MQSYRQYRISPEFRVAGLAFVSACLCISIARYYTEIFPVLWMVPFAVFLCSIWMALTDELNENHDRLLLSQTYIVLPLVIPLAFPVPAGLFIYISCLVLLFINTLVAHVEIRRQAVRFRSSTYYLLSICIGGITGIAVALAFVRWMPEKLIPIFCSVVLLCFFRSSYRNPYSEQLPMSLASAPLWESLEIPRDLKDSLLQEKQKIITQYSIAATVGKRLEALQAKAAAAWRALNGKLQKMPGFQHVPAEYRLVTKFLAFAFLMLALAAGHRFLLPLTGSEKEPFLVIYTVFYCAVVTLLCFSFRYQPLQFGISLALVLLGNSVLLHPLRLDGVDVYPEGLGASVEILMLFSALILVFSIKSPILLTVNSRYGKLQVAHNRINDSLELSSDNVVQGAQLCRGVERNEPISYYVRKGPFGQLFSALSAEPRSDSVAVIGLGVGTVAAYGREGQVITFYEIDPLMEQIACHTGYFSYVRESKAAVNIVIGDARETLAQAQDNSIGILICDAYTGGNIPKHLLTREAFSLYLEKLQEHGIIIVDISNPHLDLEWVLAKIAEDLGLVGYFRKYRPNNKQKNKPVHQAGLIAGKKPVLARQTDPVVEEMLKKLQRFFTMIGLTPHHKRFDAACSWAVLAKTPEDIALLQRDARWQPLPAAAKETLWTDDMVGYDSWTKAIEMD